MSAVVREMRWWDIEQVTQLERALFVDDAWTDTMFWSELAEHDSRHYIVADVDGSVVGYAGLCAYASGEAYVQTIGVAPDQRRGGIGTLLLTDLLADAQARGCSHVDLEVRDGNDDAIRLYERHGFHRIGVRRGYYQPSGADALVMRRKGAA